MKKSQAAMEFLMTYGWAIVVILAVLGILFGLDIFNPKVPNNCGSVSPINCHDIKLDESKTIKITLSSSDTDLSYANKIKITSPISAECNKGSISGGSPSAYGISVDDKVTLSCLITNEDLNSGNKFEGSLEAIYILSGGSIEHKVNIKFSGTVEES